MHKVLKDKFDATVGKICPSEKSHRYILLLVAVIFSLAVMGKVIWQKWAVKK